MKDMQHKLEVGLVALREATEQCLSRQLNASHEKEAGGIFQVKLNMETLPTPLGVETYYWGSDVLFYPYNLEKYKEFVTSHRDDGGIDFFDLRNSENCLKRNKRKFLNTLLDKVSETLEEKGLIILDHIVASVMESAGYEMQKYGVSEKERVSAKFCKEKLLITIRKMTAQLKAFDTEP